MFKFFASKILLPLAAILVLSPYVFSIGNVVSTKGTIHWTKVIANADGSPITDLAGYKVYIGIASGTYTIMKDVGLTPTPDTPLVKVVDISPLADGQYYAAVSAYDIAGNESGKSNEVPFFFRNDLPPAAPGSPTVLP